MELQMTQEVWKMDVMNGLANVLLKIFHMIGGVVDWAFTLVYDLAAELLSGIPKSYVVKGMEFLVLILLIRYLYRVYTAPPEISRPKLDELLEVKEVRHTPSSPLLYMLFIGLMVSAVFK